MTQIRPETLKKYSRNVRLVAMNQGRFCHFKLLEFDLNPVIIPSSYGGLPQSSYNITLLRDCTLVQQLPKLLKSAEADSQKKGYRVRLLYWILYD